jgi:Na+/H+-dicarboxylate symporter
MNNKKLPKYIAVAIMLGIVVGWGCNTFAASPDSAKEIAGYFSLVTDIFLRMIKMIIAPWCSPPWWPASAAWATPAR